jgi:hypothetical protein
MSANCETPFWKDPTVLVKKFNIDILNGCFESKANALMRAVIVLMVINTILAYFIENEGLLLILSIAILYGFMTYFNDESERIIEKFEEFASEEEEQEGFADLAEEEEGFADAGLGLADAKDGSKTLPTAANPFMNVLVDEVKYNPTRGSAAAIDCPLIQDKLENFYRVQWWSDPTDVYGKNQGQRQFYTMPSTSVPSDRQSFQDWLFKIPGKTCKEGNRDACNPGTNGGPIPWLSQPN